MLSNANLQVNEMGRFIVISIYFYYTFNILWNNLKESQVFSEHQYEVKLFPYVFHWFKYWFNLIILKNIIYMYLIINSAKI
jgi:hypothetical protein